MKEFLNNLFNLFPAFKNRLGWDIEEFPYCFFGEFALFINDNKVFIDMQSVNYIINLFLTSSFQPGDKENIIIVGFLEVLHDDIDTYNNLKENSNDELKEIFNKYLNKW